MDQIWNTLYQAALAVTCPKDVSDSMCVGGVGAAVLSKSGKIYTGVCIDTDCSLGMCAERNAISTMFTQRDYEIDKVCAVGGHGQIMPPCGACREFMMQTGKNARAIEILVREDKIMTLGELMPEYWDE